MVPLSEAIGNAWFPCHSEQINQDVKGNGDQESVKLSSNKIPQLFSTFLLSLLSAPTCFMNLTRHKISEDSGYYNFYSCKIFIFYFKIILKQLDLFEGKSSCKL